MEKSYTQLLSFGAAVEPGQWYDIRGEGLQHQSIYDAQVHEIPTNPTKHFDLNVIDSLNLGDGLCETLKIYPDSFVRNISYSKNITFMYFVLPAVPKFVLIKVEKIFKQERARFVNTVPDTTHFVKNVHYGNMVLVRLVPKNEGINLDSVTKNFDEFLKNGQHGDFVVESLTNFTEWKHHENIGAAIEYANHRIEWRDDEKRVVRFDLEKIGKKNKLWQEGEDSGEILERLLRLDFLCHSLEAFLKVAENRGIDPSNISNNKNYANLEEMSAAIDERGKALLGHDLINPSLNLSVSVANGSAKDLFQSLLILKSDVQRFLKKRTQLAHKPDFENDVIDRNVVIFNLFHSIYGFLNRHNFERHFGKLFHVIREPKHKTIICIKQRKHQKIVVVNGEKSVGDIQYYYDTFETEEMFATICLEDNFGASSSSSENLHNLVFDKSEKAWYFKGFEAPQYLGHFKPANSCHHEIENGESQNPRLILPCPCTQNQNNRFWICTECKQIVHVFDETTAICKCGTSSLKSDQFKCLNNNHPTHFLNFDDSINLPQPRRQQSYSGDENGNDEIENIFYDPQTEITYQKHPKLRDSNRAGRKKLEKAKRNSFRSKTINIAVIGQTGVGKSTLLNAISNYLKFDSAHDALNNDLEYIIPCQFKVFYDDFSEKLVSIGMPNENEIYETALSTTQECQEHSFEFDGYKINFIDTPGLSDTSGIEKDAKNLDKIRSFICSLDSLHGICFVVKANEARMDIGFANSMNDLLSIFPKSALSKVIFFMTHSRGTLYGPGDSMTPLKIVSDKLLKSKNVTFPLSSENIFCVDNESFLFLCAKNRGIEYSGASMEDFETSWKKSKQATQRFFNKITSVKPLVTVEVQLIKDLENVLQEQREILSHKHSSCLLIFHYLTAKALELLELGNVANAYLKDIDLGTVKEEAEHCNVKIDHITPSTLLSFINFCLECENGETPVADSFIDKYF